MKINDSIREKRKQLGLTQEQVADYLNITAPAVNKWEKGISYPDITLLPALARILQTDLNTLLSFHDDLTAVEISDFIASISDMIREDGYPTAFKVSMDKISQYPTSENLIASLAPCLDGALSIYGILDRDPYKVMLASLYTRLLKSNKPEFKDLATSMLISYHIEKENYMEAEELIQSIYATTIDKQQHLAQLYKKQGKHTEATKIWQEKLLHSATTLQNTLLCLMETSYEENSTEHAHFLADIYFTFTQQFSPASWLSYSSYLELATKKKDPELFIKTLHPMLSALEEAKTCTNLALYDQLNLNISAPLIEQFLTMIHRDLHTSEEFDFIRGNQEFENLIQTYRQ